MCQVPAVWTDEKKGLRKELISFEFRSVTKANELSKCVAVLSDVSGLKDEHESDYLRRENNKEVLFELGMALTPIDCYVELFLQQMMIGEKSRCSITTKSGDVIQFVLLIAGVEFGGYYYSKSLEEVVALAKRAKENGVKMFKKYPIFAHNYFNKAAKLLISLEPFDKLHERDIGKNCKDVEPLKELLKNVRLNIAACLIKQQRFEEVLHVLEFAEQSDNVPEKAIYRRAYAYLHLGSLDEAKRTLERINYQENNECNALYLTVIERWKKSNQNYSSMVKKMFA